MDRMTDEHAAGLIDRIEGLTDALEDANKSQRRLKIITGVVILFGILLAFVVLEQRSDGKDLAEIVEQNQANAVATCESGNRRIEGTRADKTGEWELQDAAAEAQGYAKDNPIRQYYADLLEWRLAELYPFRDCDHLDKQIPVPGEPPSFEAALAEALAAEQAEE